jgi:hypothetical protein
MLEKAQLLDILGQARFNKDVAELHYKLRCHFLAEEIEEDKDDGK